MTLPQGYGPGMAERLVVIGGDAAGMSAASGVRRAQPETEVVVLEKGGRTSYAACGIPFFVSGDVDDVESLVTSLAAELRPGDHVLVMSNGGFGGLHEKLLTVLRARRGP